MARKEVYRLSIENEYDTESYDEPGASTVFMISLSNCTPCMKTKSLFDSYGLSYEYVDIDNATDDEWDHVLDVLEENLPGRGFPRVYPIVVVNGWKVLQGYHEETLQTLARELVDEEDREY